MKMSPVPPPCDRPCRFLTLDFQCFEKEANNSNHNHNKDNGKWGILEMKRYDPDLMDRK